MKIPYGISNFKSLREEGYLYVDKTSYIEKLENLSGKYIFFIRPRRFGKSLFLSTLEHYYDLNAQKNFEKLFQGLYIGKQPTKLKNSYMILKLNFSGLNTNSRYELENSFRLSLINSIESFVDKYAPILGSTSSLKQKISDMTDIKSILLSLIGAVNKIDKKIYLIIDEYDHFANDIIAMGENDFYKDIVRASGFVRDFYETVKIGTESAIDRIFITGISPIMLDDLTSGFNIAMNITMDREMNEMLGFTQEEVEEILHKLGVENKELDIKLKDYYNGYLFNAEGKKRLYNPDMVLYFLSQFIREKRPPEQLIDDNVKMDYGRINRLTVNQENRKMLEKIIEDELITSDIVTRFSFDKMYDQEYFISLLFYMGLLTIDKKEKTRLILKIPNYVIKTVFWEYFTNTIKKEYGIKIDTDSLKKTIEDMAYNGTIKPFIDYISSRILKPLSNRDIIDFDEKYIKVILLSFLNISSVYIPISEIKVESGYVDIYLERDMRASDVRYEWLLELKYVKKSERKRPNFPAILEKIKADGLKQLERYKESRGLKSKDNLKQALLIFIGKDEHEVIEI